MASTADRPPAERAGPGPGHYPVLLDLRDRPCLVVGGGPVAEARVRGLLEAGARVTVVSPTLTERLEAWARAGRLRHLARVYEAQDAEGHRLVFAATGDRAVTEALARDGRAGGAWVNAADAPAHCDVLLPSVLRRGRLVVSVGTGGAAPGLARAIREDLEGHFTGDWAALVELVADVRRELRARAASPPPEAWRHALDPELRGLLAGGRHHEARALLAARLGASPCP